MAKAKLGSGQLFKAFVAKVKARNKRKNTKKVNNPAALAAWVGRRKYGAKKFAKLSAAGRK